MSPELVLDFNLQHWYTMWSVQNWFWTFNLPAIRNVRLTLFSCLRENHSTLHEVLFTISTVTEQPVVCFVELHGQCGIDPRELGPIPALKKRYIFYRQLNKKTLLQNVVFPDKHPGEILVLKFGNLFSNLVTTDPASGLASLAWKMKNFRTSLTPPLASFPTTEN